MSHQHVGDGHLHRLRAGIWAGRAGIGTALGHAHHQIVGGDRNAIARDQRLCDHAGRPTSNAKTPADLDKRLTAYFMFISDYSGDSPMKKGGDKPRPSCTNQPNYQLIAGRVVL